MKFFFPISSQFDMASSEYVLSNKIGERLRERVTPDYDRELSEKLRRGGWGRRPGELPNEDGAAGW